MNIKDGRGANRAELKKENIAKIKRFFKNNPGAIKKDCAEATGLSYSTILNLTKEINNE